MERAILSNLPNELGEYALKSNGVFNTSGEIIVVGPPLTAIKAYLDEKSPYHMSNSKTQAAALKTFSAVQEARSLLNLSTDEAMLLGELFSGPNRFVDTAMDCSIAELCAFYNKYAKSDVWLALCDLWDKGLSILMNMKVSY